jgi:hypothetical protein
MTRSVSMTLTDMDRTVLLAVLFAALDRRVRSEDSEDRVDPSTLLAVGSFLNLSVVLLRRAAPC